MIVDPEQTVVPTFEVIETDGTSVGFTVTTLVSLVVPQSPVAVAVIVAVPLNPASQFITPVAELMDPAVAGETE
jgi:hypothetical protein